MLSLFLKSVILQSKDIWDSFRMLYVDLNTWHTDRKNSDRQQM